MNKNEAVEEMIKKVLNIEAEEDVHKFKKEGDMKKDAVKKILNALKGVEIDEN
jgi:hypothetical protein